MSKSVLQIIIGSTRSGRVGLPVAEWTLERASADAFVFVLREYTFGYHAALKKRHRRPARELEAQSGRLRQLCGVAAGTRAVQGLKQVVTALKMVPLFGS